MKNNYILVDYENVQPTNLALLQEHEVRVIVFVGAKQKSVPIALAMSLQALGKKGSYQQITDTRKNALDFQIAFYLGELAAREPAAYFHILSKDKGFDPLIIHMRARQIAVCRRENILEIPFLRENAATAIDAQIDRVAERLIALKQARPKKPETLANTLNAIFCNGLDTEAQQALIEEMQRRKMISISDQAVNYGACISGQ